MLASFRNWTTFEKVWLIAATLTLVTLEVIWRDQWLGFIASITGIICVVLAAKGKVATFYFGIVNAVTYAIVAYGYALYGEAMLNMFFYLPTQFIGLFLWYRHRKAQAEQVNGEDVYTRRLTAKQWAIGTPVVLVATGAYIYLLAALNAAQVHLDGVAVVLSITAQILLLLRYAEQWILWIVVNVITIALWALTLVQSGGNDYALLVMWIAYLVNSVYGYINWRRLSDPNRYQATTPQPARQTVEA